MIGSEDFVIIKHVTQNWPVNYRDVNNDAGGMANCVDPDQTAQSSLIWVCTVCSGISVRKLRIITVGLAVLQILSN